MEFASGALDVVEGEDGGVGDGPIVLGGEGGEFGGDAATELEEDVGGIEVEEGFVVEALLVAGDGERGREGQVVAVAGDDVRFEAEIFECDGEGGREADDAR